MGRAPSLPLQISLDLADTDLAAIPACRGATAVACGKHLCGAATDLALRAVERAGSRNGLTFDGLAIATCCRHRCCWR